jgi:hypothetical protein
MTISSPAFFNGATMPPRYSGEGDNVSPPLRWRGTPKATRQLALICEDPDAPSDRPWVHWLVYNLSPEVDWIPEDLPRQPVVTTPVSLYQGTNSWSDAANIGYRGPLPPRQHAVHHYTFRLFALADELNLPPGVDRSALDRAMSGKILTRTELVGTYRR